MWAARPGLRRPGQRTEVPLGAHTTPVAVATLTRETAGRQEAPLLIAGRVSTCMCGIYSVHLVTLLTVGQLNVFTHKRKMYPSQVIVVKSVAIGLPYSVDRYGRF